MMTEAELDLVHRVADRYWHDFSQLVGETLSKVPSDLHPYLLQWLQDKSSVYGSAYEDYLKKGD